MKHYLVTIEHDYHGVYEGILVAESVEINDEVTIKLHTRKPQYKTGIVIMFQEFDNE